jgi:protein TonB
MTRTTATAICPTAPGRSPLLFQSLTLARPLPLARRWGKTFFVSASLHSALLSGVVVLPLLVAQALPGARQVTTFFAAPLEMVTLPPPPPAPPGGGPHKLSTTPRPTSRDPGLFVPNPDLATPILIDDWLAPEGDGDPNGVRGGVPGGVIGSVLTDLPPAPPPPPRTKVVRISQLDAPKLLRRVAPAYPELAIASHVSAVVTLDAEIDTRGRVRNVSVVAGNPLFDAAAIEAVRQWIYKPLLLNGEPTGFILNVTIAFQLR